MRCSTPRSRTGLCSGTWGGISSGWSWSSPAPAAPSWWGSAPGSPSNRSQTAGGSGLNSNLRLNKFILANFSFCSRPNSDIWVYYHSTLWPTVHWLWAAAVQRCCTLGQQAGRGEDPFSGYGIKPAAAGRGDPAHFGGGAPPAEDRGQHQHH